MNTFLRAVLSRTGAAVCFVACTAVTGSLASEQYTKPVISPLDNASSILEEEEMEMSLAEKRVGAKLLKIYDGNKNTLVKPRPSKVHDRVTFVIKDTTTTSLEANTMLETSLTTNWNLQNWFTLDRNSNGDLTLKPYSMTSTDGTINTATQSDNYSQIKMDTNSEHDGKGKTDRKNTFTTKLSGEVIEVLPNGHLVVEAKKSIRINNETQTVTLVGRVDPEDLNDASEIDGDRIIDLNIALAGEGEVTDAIQPGFITKLINKFKPF